MKIAVMGATGPSGEELVKQCLEQGHTVKALVRDLSKLTTQHANFQAQKIDLSKVENVASAINGVDVVMSCLGVGKNRGMCTPCTFYTDTIEVITSAMQQSDVSRLVLISAWGSKDEPGQFFMMAWVYKPTFLRNLLPDMGRMEDYLEDAQCKNINYTVVRPPVLTMGPVTEKEIRTREGQFVRNASHYMSRADVARFMLDCLKTVTYDRKMVAVGVDD